jgi:hypothetical protein
VAERAASARPVGLGDAVRQHGVRDIERIAELARPPCPVRPIPDW